MGLAQNNLSLPGVKHNPVDGRSNEITRTILVSGCCIAGGRRTRYGLPQGIDHDLFQFLSPMRAIEPLSSLRPCRIAWLT